MGLLLRKTVAAARQISFRDIVSELIARLLLPRVRVSFRWNNARLFVGQEWIVVKS